MSSGRASTPRAQTVDLADVQRAALQAHRSHAAGWTRGGDREVIALEALLLYRYAGDALRARGVEALPEDIAEAP